MAWLKSHQTLERHPKVLELERYCTMDRNGTIGVLHRFWYWVMDYAEDGDLRKFKIETISDAIGIDANNLIKSGWIDEKPYLRVHDWYDYFGEYFRCKYRKSPRKYEAFRHAYTGKVPELYQVRTKSDKIREDKIREDKNAVSKKRKPAVKDKKHHIVKERLVDYYLTKLKEKYGANVNYPKGAARGIFGDMLKQKIDSVVIIQTIDKWFQNASQFHVGRGYLITDFKTNFNGFLSKEEKQKLKSLAEI